MIKILNFPLTFIWENIIIIIVFFVINLNLIEIISYNKLKMYKKIGGN